MTQKEARSPRIASLSPALFGKLGAGVWVLVPVIMAWFMLDRPISDNDILWQIRLGDLMLAERAVVWREPFAATHLGERMVPLSALAQVIMAMLHQIGGWRAVQIIDALAWTGGFFAAGLAARSRGAGTVGLMIALILMLAFVPYSGLRPQSFAVLCFGLLILLLRQDWPWQKWLPAGAILFVLWQNLHPSVSVAAAYLGARGGAGWLLWLLKRRSMPPLRETVLAVLAAAAVLATPAGAEILSVSLTNARISRDIGVSEWLPMFDTAMRGTWPLNILMLVTVSGMLWLRRREIDLEELLGALMLLGMSLFVVRFLTFWSVALVPVLAGREMRTAATRHTTEWLLYGTGIAVAALIACLSGPVKAYPDVPEAGIERLKTAQLKGTIYGSLGFGPALIYSGWPDWKVVIDSRYYRYSPQEWTFLNAVRNGSISPAELDRRYRPVAWLLSTNSDAKLIVMMRADRARWHEIQSDAKSVAFLPATTTPLPRR